jgi:hypothetical protein
MKHLSEEKIEQLKQKMIGDKEWINYKNWK